jgi:quercetin dioxygenase-like cupin family protein
MDGGAFSNLTMNVHNYGVPREQLVLKEQGDDAIGRYLVAGKRVSMRIWIDEPGEKLKGPSSREYETVGYVISGSAKLEIEGQTLNLKRGDSWLVPAGAMHQYTIIEPFTAVEATAPPAEVHGRDTAE